MPLRCLLLDNYDSYTYNLYQLLAAVNGGGGGGGGGGMGGGAAAACRAWTLAPTPPLLPVPPTVIRNDAVPWTALAARLVAGEWQCVVVSPGPGSPSAAADVGVCAAAVTGAAGVPVLGVCLGMQALAVAFGGSVGRADPVHGRLSEVSHDGAGLFAGLPTGAGAGNLVVRYHSLAVDEASLPDCLVATAWTVGPTVAVATASASAPARSPPGPPAPPVLMGIRHATLPLYGVQFHPESVATSHGRGLLSNFRDIALAAAGLPTGPPPPLPPAATLIPPSAPGGLHLAAAAVRAPRLAAEAAPLFDALVLPACARATPAAPDADAWWLDSAATDRARFSFMGGPLGGPLWRRLEYELPPPDGCKDAVGVLTTTDGRGRVEETSTGFFDHLDAALARAALHPASAATAAALSVPFVGGYVGFLGYELKAECGGARAHAAPAPDAALWFADRLLAVDHATGDVHVLALYEEGEEESALEWVRETAAEVAALDAAPPPPPPPPPPPTAPPTFTVARGHATYLADVGACLEALAAGESYELCLTTALDAAATPSAPLPDPLALYRVLRRVNPAPYAAYLAVGAAGPRVACTSPERFLRGAPGGGLEAKPIKGTAARVAGDVAADAAAAATLAGSEKDRSENLMIVDLLRNDLGAIAAPGSVSVPSLMAVESYATVHQLVSTVTATRAATTSPVAAVRSAFPGGSMTGAPKLRSMAILDTLEKRARGVYSGCVGYFSAAGAFDLNIVIRTAVARPAHGTLSIGAGGAVVVQSGAEAEYDEMLLKAAALMRAVGAVAGSGEPARVVG